MWYGLPEVCHRCQPSSRHLSVELIVYTMDLSRSQTRGPRSPGGVRRLREAREPSLLTAAWSKDPPLGRGAAAVGMSACRASLPSRLGARVTGAVRKRSRDRGASEGQYGRSTGCRAVEPAVQRNGSESYAQASQRGARVSERVQEFPRESESASSRTFIAVRMCVYSNQSARGCTHRECERRDQHVRVVHCSWREACSLRQNRAGGGSSA